MRLCSQAGEAELKGVLAALGPLPVCRDVRAAEAGLVMVRGRTGGTGAAFNFGEATVARAVVTLECGTMGFGYVLGRSLAKARLAALIDALGQTASFGQRVEHALQDIVGVRVAAEREARQAEIAATRVEFFTMQRGED